MNRNRWLVVIVIALILSVALTFIIFRTVSRQLTPTTVMTTKVVVATEKLALGKVITATDVKLAEWPASTPVDGGFSDIQAVIDRAVINTIYPNEPILEAKLAPKDGGNGLSAVIPDGMRAVSVRVDSVIGVAGFVLPGTRVDVILTGTPAGGNETASRIILENVQVLTAGTNIEQSANGKPQEVSVVTLLVTPEQAQELVLAGQDRIQLALRNPLDKEEKDPDAIRRNKLFASGKPEPSKPVQVAPTPRRPKPAVVTPPPPKPEPPVYAIEIISGNNKATLKFTEDGTSENTK